MRSLCTAHEFLRSGQEARSRKSRLPGPLAWLVVYQIGMSSACRLLATQRSMKTGSSLLTFATTCGPEVVSLTGALEPVDEFDPGRALAQRTVASS